MVQVVIKTRVIDSVYVDVMRSVRELFPKEGVMSLGVCSVGSVEIL